MNILPQRLPKGIQDGIGRAVGGVGITPNMISLFGFFGNLLAAWLITREEVADAVAWLCSPGASAMTGVALPVAAGEVT